MCSADTVQASIRTNVPARLDQLSWTSFHSRMFDRTVPAARRHWRPYGLTHVR
jgi:hypothetical protein